MMSLLRDAPMVDKQPVQEEESMFRFAKSWLSCGRVGSCGSCAT